MVERYQACRQHTIRQKFWNKIFKAVDVKVGPALQNFDWEKSEQVVLRKDFKQCLTIMTFMVKITLKSLVVVFIKILLRRDLS